MLASNGYYAHYQDEAVLPYTTASLSDKKPSFLQTGARQYFPKLGRYLQEDPIMDGLNWFIYCNNNPASGIDPTGKVTVLLCHNGKKEDDRFYHMWIRLPGGACWGFHPKDDGRKKKKKRKTVAGEGIVARDDSYMDNLANVFCISYYIDAYSYEEMLREMYKDYKSPPRYKIDAKYVLEGNSLDASEEDIAVNENCQTWATKKLRNAKNPPSPP